MGPPQTKSLTLTLAKLQRGDTVHKEDLLDLLHWVKQIAAVAFGLVCGILPLTGLPAFLAGLAVITFATFVAYRALRVDEEEYGGHQELLMDGAPVGVAMFLLTWVVTWNIVHKPMASVSA